MEEIKYFLHSASRLLCIVGPSQSGKTTQTLKLIKESGYSYIRPDFNTKNFEESIKAAIYTNTIDFFTLQVCRKPVVIFLDDLEMILTHNRTTKSVICKILADTSVNVKCIITCSPSEEKRLNDLKKNNFEYTVVRLTKDKEIPENKPYIDKSIYDLTRTIFDNWRLSAIQDIEIGISSDPMLISFMMYDNAHSYLDKVGMSNMYKTFCDLSIIEEFCFHNGDWGMIDIYALVQCGKIRLEQQRIGLGSSDADRSIAFTQIPCRSSQRYCVIKKQYSQMLKRDLDYSDFFTYNPKEKLNLRTEHDQAVHAIHSNLMTKSTTKSIKRK